MNNKQLGNILTNALNKVLEYEEAKRRWNELKISSSRRELSDKELDEFDALYKIVKSRN